MTQIGRMRPEHASEETPVAYAHGQSAVDPAIFFEWVLCRVITRLWGQHTSHTLRLRPRCPPSKARQPKRAR